MTLLRTVNNFSIQMLQLNVILKRKSIAWNESLGFNWAHMFNAYFIANNDTDFSFPLENMMNDAYPHK